MERIEIETPRLILKSVTPAIINQLFETAGKDKILEFFGTDDKGYERLAQMHQQGMETHRISVFWFMLTDKQTGRVLGDCGFHTWNKTHARAEIFYNLTNEDDKAKGLMTEALERVIDFGFSELKLHRLQGNVASWNTPSVKLLKKFGFTFEGTLREDYVENGISTDSDCYSLLRHEWQNRAQPKL